MEDGIQWGIPVTSEEVEQNQKRTVENLSHPLPRGAKEWFPVLSGAKVLGLASGGGQQMPILSVLGAECTVMDYSDRQLGKRENGGSEGRIFH